MSRVRIVRFLFIVEWSKVVMNKTEIKVVWEEINCATEDTVEEES